MAHPRWKGPREQVQLMLPPADKERLAARARLAGISYSEYVMALLDREDLDDAGAPAWLRHHHDGEALALAM